MSFQNAFNRLRASVLLLPPTHSLYTLEYFLTKLLELLAIADNDYPEFSEGIIMLISNLIEKRALLLRTPVDICSICLENPRNSLAPFTCYHRLCNECFHELLIEEGSDAKCPVCRAPRRDYYYGQIG